MTRTALTTTLINSAALILTACSAAETATDTATDAVKSATKVASASAAPIVGAVMDMTPGADISEISSGTYKIDPGHGYVAFSYLHGKYSRPILRWGVVDATVELDSENPENSTLSVSIPTASIDSGVKVWDEKLVKADWFDAETFPTITFTSTELNEVVQGRGTLTGNLTLKGITKPITLDVKLNGVGQHFRHKRDIFGISATGSMKRGDFGVDTYLPSSADITLQVEAEFIKIPDAE